MARYNGEYVKDSEVIDCAIDLILTYGWTRRAFGVMGGPHCLLGAWNECLTGHANAYTSNVSDMVTFPYRLFRQASGVENVVTWNDSQAESQEEVVATLLTMYNLAIKEEQRVGTEGRLRDE